MSKKRRIFIFSNDPGLMLGSALTNTGCLLWDLMGLIVTVCIIAALLYYALIGLAIAAGIAAVVAIIVAIVKHCKKVKAAKAAEAAQSTQTVEPVEDSETVVPIVENPQRQAILREIEILKDCERLVNDSADLEVVASRYELLLHKLDLLIAYPPETLAAFGISVGSPLESQKQTVIESKVAVFNQAIDRAFEQEHIAALETDADKSNALLRFYNDTLDAIHDFNLSDECLTHLNDICRAV